MAASPVRFSFSHAVVELSETFPEWEGAVEETHHDDVRVVCTEMRKPEPGWFVRLFDPATGRLIGKLQVTTSELVTPTQARASGPLPGGGQWSLVAKREGCNC